jgi:hypothetical protein
MPDQPYNKYRAAIEILQRGRDTLVEGLAEDVLEQEEHLLDGGFQFHEFLESQGARLHFLGLIVSHLEQSAELIDEIHASERRSTSSQGKPPGSRARKKSRGRGAPFSKPRGESASDSTGTSEDPPL